LLARQFFQDVKTGQSLPVLTPTTVKEFQTLFESIAKGLEPG
jgi:hypothetical protein